MDELVIGDKKYISSKQAAKATGYAKDYVGQLCREGRVPARLVGRSWYVLESAIHDHRFTGVKDGQDKNAKSTSSAISPLQSTWESPRYETQKEELLPSVNRLRGEEPLISEESQGDESGFVQQRLQDTWQAWFEHFDRGNSVPQVGTAAFEMSEQANAKGKWQSEEENVPITVHRSHYQLPPEDLLPRRFSEMEQETLPEARKRVISIGRTGVRTIRLAGTLFMTVMITLAVFGSGYLDEFVISNNRVGLIAGVVVYNK